MWRKVQGDFKSFDAFKNILHMNTKPLLLVIHETLVEIEHGSALKRAILDGNVTLIKYLISSFSVLCGVATREDGGKILSRFFQVSGLVKIMCMVDAAIAENDSEIEDLLSRLTEVISLLLRRLANTKYGCIELAKSGDMIVTAYKQMISPKHMDAILAVGNAAYGSSREERRRAEKYLKSRENMAAAVANICCASAETEDEDQELIYARSQMLGCFRAGDRETEETLDKIANVEWFKEKSCPLKFSVGYCVVASGHMLAMQLPISKLVEAEGGVDASTPTLVRRSRVFSSPFKVPEQDLLCTQMSTLLGILRAGHKFKKEREQASRMHEDFDEFVLGRRFKFIFLNNKQPAFGEFVEIERPIEKDGVRENKTEFVQSIR